MALVLRGPALIDGKGGRPVPNVDVLIEGDRIAAIESHGVLPVPPGASVMDLTGKWLLPGLIDLHIHSYSYDDPPNVKVQPEAYTALLAARNLYGHLCAGVTTVRDVGAQRAINISAARAIKEKVIPGPRMFACGMFISQTGGHCSENPLCAREANGVDDVRAAVREQWKAGATWIKLTVNGYPSVPEFTQGEIDAAVDETHRLGLKLACHASILSATWPAINAGVDTIEHGCELDEAICDAMAEKGIVLIPTGAVYVGLAKERDDKGMGPEASRVLWERAATHKDAIRNALKAGVKIGAGTDWAPIHVPEELVFLVNAGLTPMQAIQSATQVGAETLGIADQVGTLAPGKLADMIVVDRDPLADIAALRDVTMVIQNGRIVKSADKSTG